MPGLCQLDILVLAPAEGPEYNFWILSGAAAAVGGEEGSRWGGGKHFLNCLIFKLVTNLGLYPT